MKLNFITIASFSLSIHISGNDINLRSENSIGQTLPATKIQETTNQPAALSGSGSRSLADIDQRLPIENNGQRNLEAESFQGPLVDWNSILGSTSTPPKPTPAAPPGADPLSPSTLLSNLENQVPSSNPATPLNVSATASPSGGNATVLEKDAGDEYCTPKSRFGCFWRPACGWNKIEHTCVSHANKVANAK